MYRQLNSVNQSNVDIFGTAAIQCVGIVCWGVTPRTLAYVNLHWRQPFYVRRWITRMIIERVRLSDYCTKLHVVTFQ
jgi:hypothetical protein